MNTATLDTPSIARRLQAAGFSEGQAEAVTGVLRDSRETDLSYLATKADLGVVRRDLKSEIGSVKTELRTEIAETKYEILKWVLSAIGFQTIVVVGAIVALAKGLH
jgi:hypothetical protein